MPRMRGVDALNMVWAALLGLVFGAGQCWLLILGVRSLGSERLKIWAFVVQFFCPMVGLLLCAAVLPEGLAACGIAMAAALICGAVGELTAIRRRSKKGKGDGTT